MVKRFLVGLILASFVFSCFAGYSSGGRSGYSGGSRSYSSSSFSGRSGYSRSTNTTRAYVAPRTYTAPRSYSGSSSNTVIHNNHYSHGGSGLGGGFFSGMLGGYLGGTLANNHQATVVAGGAPMVQGQGMMMEGAPMVAGVSPVGNMIGAIIGLMFAGFFIWLLVVVTKHFLGTNQRSRW